MNRNCKYLSILVAASILPLLVGQKLFAFTIFPDNHQHFTELALAENWAFRYTMPNGLQVTFSAVALSSITQGNENVDVYTTFNQFLGGKLDKYHFDSEEFNQSQSIIDNIRDQIVINLRDSAFGELEFANLGRQNELISQSRELLGNSLHILQDFYSHSNWVEQGHSDINENVGKKGVPFNDPPESSVCSEGSPGEAGLTSGYYEASNILECLTMCDAPPNKCAHGAVSICPQDCGINKDEANRANFSKASSLAIEHTAHFVTALLNEVLTTTGPERYAAETAVCLFMGRTLTDDCHKTAELRVYKLDNETASSAISEGIVVSDPVGIDCGNTCVAGLFVGLPVRLTAGYSAGWKFVKWAYGGECALSTNPVCVFTMPENATVATAIFEECTNDNCHAKVYAISNNGHYVTPVEISITSITYVKNPNPNDTWTNSTSQAQSILSCDSATITNGTVTCSGPYPGSICEIEGVWVPISHSYETQAGSEPAGGCSGLGQRAWASGSFQLEASGQVTVQYEQGQNYSYSCTSFPYTTKSWGSGGTHRSYSISLASGGGSFSESYYDRSNSVSNTPYPSFSEYTLNGSGGGNWPAEEKLPPALPGVNLTLLQTYSSGEELPGVCAPTPLP